MTYWPACKGLIFTFTFATTLMSQEMHLAPKSNIVTAIANHTAMTRSLEEYMARPLDGPFSNFVQWIDDITTETQDVLTDNEIDTIQLFLKTSYGLSDDTIQAIATRVKNMARVTTQIYEKELQDRKTNIYLFRDAFTLYVTEKIYGGHPKAIFLSKAILGHLGSGDSMIYLTTHEIAHQIKQEMGYPNNKPLPSELYPEFRRRFLELFAQTMSEQATAMDILQNNFNHLGLAPGTSIRFVDTKKFGAIALLLEGLIHTQGMPFSTETRMVYSELLPAISIQDKVSAAILLECKFYPAIFDQQQGINSDGEFMMRTASFEKDKVPFLYLLILFRNEVLKIYKQNRARAFVQTQTLYQSA